MPTGCCGGATCSCKLAVEGDGPLAISGSGQPNDPFIFDMHVERASTHNITFDTIAGGDGTDTDPWTVETMFAPTAKLDHIPDVNAPGPTNGQVLAWNSSTSRWVAQAPTVAPTGAVSHDTSLAGDGSPATPLGVAPITARLLGTFATGLGLTDLGMTSVVQHFANAAGRTAAITVPVLNMLTMLDTNPGVVEYWTGSKWSVLPNQTTWTAVDEFMQLSGDYTPGLPITVSIIQLNTTSDSLGVIDVLSAADLLGKSGVLAVNVQESGAIGWKAMVYPNVDRVSATAFRLTDGTPMAGQPLTATIQAVLY
jgi:hypothetical protein